MELQSDVNFNFFTFTQPFQNINTTYSCSDVVDVLCLLNEVRFNFPNIMDVDFGIMSGSNFTKDAVVSSWICNTFDVAKFYRDKGANYNDNIYDLFNCSNYTR